MKIILSIAFVLCIFGSTLTAHAQQTITGTGTQSTSGTGTQSTQSVSLPNPLCPSGDKNCAEGSSVPGLIGRVINAVLGIVGSLALLMFIYGGFTWMLSGGNSSAVEKGKNILIWASLGLVIIFISYALVSFVINTATSGG